MKLSGVERKADVGYTTAPESSQKTPTLTGLPHPGEDD
jgi:hypothetical protein